MTTIFIAAQPDDVRAVLPWAGLLAEATGHGLTIVLPQRKKGDSRLTLLSDRPETEESELVTACRSALADLAKTRPPESAATEHEESAVQVYQLFGDAWTIGLANHLKELKPSAVIVPAPAISKEQDLSDDWQTELMGETECEVMLIQGGVTVTEAGQNPRLAAVLHAGVNHERTLELCAQLVAAGSASATAVYVEPRVGDLAVSVGMKSLGDLLRQTLNREQFDQLERRVVVSNRLTDAVQQLHDESYDLILMRASRLTGIRRFFKAGGGRQESDHIPALAVIRPAESLSRRIRSRADRWLRSVVPQLSRDERIDLVSRIESSSQWDFDFIFLVSLSTLIACLGLAEDSGAVIVGAMLVAPLMTPIAGVGLGVAHGNSFLTKVALRTALRGFATAMLIGVVFGLSVRIVSSIGWLEPLRILESGSGVYPAEIENRTHPQFYDLLIALASGVAAAYAMGRPNLFAALPGVAIAAALVPPVATTGIALSYGDVVKGGGALLLFVTNMVTIILGASLVFRAVGIRTQKEGEPAAGWPRYSLLLLVILSILVTVLIELVRSARG